MWLSPLALEKGSALSSNGSCWFLKVDKVEQRSEKELGKCQKPQILKQPSSIQDSSAQMDSSVEREKLSTLQHQQELRQGVFYSGRPVALFFAKALRHL